MVSEAVQETLAGRISNFTLEDEGDRQNYEEVSELSGTRVFVDALKGMDPQRYDLGTLTRVELEQEHLKACGLMKKGMIEAAEYRTLLMCLDVKISRIIRVIEEGFIEGFIKPEDFIEALAINGFTPKHKLFRHTEEMPSKPADHPSLRLVKK